jgi:hypothetical protein
MTLTASVYVIFWREQRVVCLFEKAEGRDLPPSPR